MYRLEKYHTPASRHTCPKCGRKRCFTLYIDTETQRPIDPTCGKCDHLNSCGYHLPPREFFRLSRAYGTPESFLAYRDYRESRARRASAPPRPATPPPAPLSELMASQPQAPHSPKGANMQSADRDNEPHEPHEPHKPHNPHEPYKPYKLPGWQQTTLSQWLAREFNGQTERLDEVCAQYHIEAWPDHRVVFWQIDTEGRVMDGKIMDYLPDGHRTGHPSWVSAELRRQGLLPDGASTQKCLFGLHLLAGRPADTTVCLVEGEKTALWCAMRYPDFIWMATGGCQALRPEALRPLMDRRLIVWPDSGSYTRWADTLARTGHRAYTVHNLDCLPPNWDIVDLMTNQSNALGRPLSSLSDRMSDTSR